MTWWMWLIVVVISLVSFVLGGYAALVFAPRMLGQLDVDRVNAALGICLMVVAGAVVVDIVYLQANYRDFTEKAAQADRAQVECNRKTLDSLAKISVARRQVDEYARAFDLALIDYLRESVLVGKPATKTLATLDEATDRVAQSRADMLTLYARTDLYPRC